MPENKTFESLANGQRFLYRRKQYEKHETRSINGQAVNATNQADGSGRLFAGYEDVTPLAAVQLSLFGDDHGR